LAHGWGDWEEGRLARVRITNREAADHLPEKTLLYDRAGKPLLVQRPRQVGFR
jgi:hypothetical protein